METAPHRRSKAQRQSPVPRAANAAMIAPRRERVTAEIWRYSFSELGGERGDTGAGRDGGGGLR